MVVQMLGDVDLSRYVSVQREITDARKREINELISELEKNCLNVEKRPLELLRLEAAQYPRLDPSFLEMANLFSIKGQTIQVPKFSVYPRTDNGFGEFSMTFEEGDIPLIRGSTWRDIYVAFNVPLPREFITPLKKSLGLEEQAKKTTIFTNSQMFSTLFFQKLPKDTARKYKAIGAPQNSAISYSRAIGFRSINELPDSFGLRSTFNGIIPAEVKKELGKVREMFNNGVYLVAETRPEQWNFMSIVTDPLLVGVYDQNCYLVSHFNTTPLEGDVAKKFKE